MAIDDPLDAYRDEFDPFEMHPVPARLWAVAKVLAKHGSGYAFLGDAIEAGFGKQASTARLKQLLDGIIAEIKRLNRKLEEVQLRQDGFIETLIAAADHTQRTVNMGKVKRFSAVLGRELVKKEPDWEEAQAFIRDISELGEEDIKALRRLYEAEQQYQQQPIGNRNLRHVHDEDFYTKNGLINNDEFYSRCGRLYGFGLALLNHETTLAAPQHQLFRISPRGFRLVKILTTQ